MYKKKDRKAMYITLGVVAAVIILLITLTAVKNARSRRALVVTEEVPTHEILIYKTVGGNIEFDKRYLVSENEKEVHLVASEDELISMLAKPLSGRVFGGLTINDASDITKEENYLVNDDTGDAKRINFVMPHTDIIMNFRFNREEVQPEPEPETEKKETETEKQSETGSPYGLRLHGLSAEVIASYNGMFDDRVFLQTLGDELHISSSESAYHTVTDVTFSEEPYSGEEESDKVFHYIYFNHDKEWKVLATYFKHENAYVFTEATDDEPETAEDNSDTSGDGNNSNASGNGTGGNALSTGSGTGSTNTGSGGYSSGGYSTAGGSYSSSGETTTEASLDIMQVSKTFLKYVGGEEPFYSRIFDYVLLKGLTGQIVGTMSSYKIYPDDNRADFTITLSTGGTVKGTYRKDKDSFSFTGL